MERQTFRHAAVRVTPPREMTSADGQTVIGALPRRAGEFQALSEWMTELGLRDRFDEFFFVEMGVERGGVQLPEITGDPEAAAIYQAGADGLRMVAAHLPGKEFFVQAQQRGIPAAMLFAPEDVVEDPHFTTRGFFVDVEHEDLGRAFLYPGPGLPGARFAVEGAGTCAPCRRARRTGATGGGRGVMEKFEARVIVSGLGLSDTGRGLGRNGLDLALDAASPRSATPACTARTSTAWRPCRSATGLPRRSSMHWGCS